MGKIFALRNRLFLTLGFLLLTLQQGCGQKQDACALIKEDGGYAQNMEEVVCSPSAPLYIKDLIGAVIVSHSDKHKPSEALGWISQAVAANNNIVSQHYHSVLLASKSSSEISPESWAILEDAAKNGARPAIESMINRQRESDLSNEKNKVDLLAWMIIGAVPPPILDAEIKNLDSFRILEYLAGTVDKTANFSMENYIAKNRDAYVAEIQSDASAPYLSKAKARAIELAKYQLEFDDSVGRYVDAKITSEQPKTVTTSSSSQTLSDVVTTHDGVVGSRAVAAQESTGGNVPIIKDKEGEDSPSQYVTLNEHIIYDQGDHSISFEKTFDINGEKVILLELHAGCMNYCYSYRFLKIDQENNAVFTDEFGTSYPLVSVNLQANAVKVVLTTPGGRNDQEWTYTNGILAQTRDIDMQIESAADHVDIPEWDAPVRVRGSVAKASDGQGYIFRFAKKTLLTGSCDYLLDEFSLDIPANGVSLGIDGVYEVAISCPNAGIFGKFIKLVNAAVEPSTPVGAAGSSNSSTDTNSAAAKIIAAAKECLRKNKLDCAKSKAEAALDIDPGNSEAIQIQRRAEEAQKKAFDGDWGAE